MNISLHPKEKITKESLSWFSQQYNEHFSFGWALEMKITFFYIIFNKHMKRVNASTTNIYNLS